MTDVKKLLAEATPLPWRDAGYDNRHDDLYGCDLAAGSNAWITMGGGREGGEGSMLHADAALIVHAVNSLPDYEAAVDALDKLGERHHALSDHDPGTVWRMRPAFEGLSECNDYTCVDARAALRRLRAANEQETPAP